MFTGNIKFMTMLVTVILSGAILLSGCDSSSAGSNDAIASNSVFESAEMTENLLVDEKLDKTVQNMPEIVFVMSHCLDNTNILGLYVTNTGDVKMYDFNKIAPGETYEIPDVYDKLKDAYCKEIDFQAVYGHGSLMTENELTPVSEEKLTECYKTLIPINESAVKKPNDTVIGSREDGHYKYYGVKNTGLNEQEFILLSGSGYDYLSGGFDYDYVNSDSGADDIVRKIYNESFEHFSYCRSGAWTEE